MARPATARLLAGLAVAGLLLPVASQVYNVTLVVNTTVTGTTHVNAGINCGHNWVSLGNIPALCGCFISFPVEVTQLNVTIPPPISPSGPRGTLQAHVDLHVANSRYRQSAGEGALILLTVAHPVRSRRSGRSMWIA